MGEHLRDLSVTSSPLTSLPLHVLSTSNCPAQELHPPAAFQNFLEPLRMPGSDSVLSMSGSGAGRFLFGILPSGIIFSRKKNSRWDDSESS